MKRVEDSAPETGERRTSLAGLRQVDAAGQAARIQQIALHHCLDRIGGRLEIPLSAIHDEPQSDVVIRGDVDIKTGDRIVVVELRPRV